MECQRLIDITHLKCDVVEAYHAWFLDLGHRNLLCQSADQVGSAGSRSNGFLGRESRGAEPDVCDQPLSELPQAPDLGRYDPWLSGWPSAFESVIEGKAAAPACD